MELKVQTVIPTALERVTTSAAGSQVPSLSFGGAFSHALEQTSALQKDAGRLTKQFTLESATVSLEETMIAGVKSNIAFQTTLQVRNRMVQAYTDIMNMQV